MKFYSKAFFAFCFLFFAFHLAHATHYRAGEVLYELIGNYKYRITIITYSKYDLNSVPADKDQVEILWGDGTSDTLNRSNGVDGDGNGFKDGIIISNSPISIKKNEYIGVHTYPGAPPKGFFLISFQDLNRINGITNINDGNTVDLPFYVEDTLKYPTDLSNIGFNSSPVLMCPPIDYANCNDTFYHNPCAIDSDGDSLDFQLIPCMQDIGTNVPVYSYPDAYCRAHGQPGCNLTINKHTGELIWATPCTIGIFNIAILIREYRGGVCIGTMIRDMQIIVSCEFNDPPHITALRDTCVRAGDSLRIRVTARDPVITQAVTLSAEGGAFHVANSPATFPVVTGNAITSTFTWNTECSHIQKQDYVVVFRAIDDFPNSPLVYLETWQIHVIAPPPLNLTGTASHQSVTLNWDNPYVCASSPDFRGFSVWRKDGCDPFVPDYCETGLDGRGYTKITTANIFTYTYTDNTTVVGQEYTYRVVAHFSKLSPNGNFQFEPNESVPSNEVCIYMPIDVPVILNVDVQQTDAANGKIYLRWKKPFAGGNNLDTIQNPPPYRYDIYRSSGSTFSNPVLIQSTPDRSSYSALFDSTFDDTNINTKDGAWSYKIFFYSANDTVGASAMASSVYLKVQSSDQSLYLSWQENVPWMNDSFAIYKLNKTTSVYDPIDTVYTHNYTDVGLINDSTYCYYVQSYGHYTLDSFPKPLINKSQEDCGIPIDTLAPCPPTLFARNDCDQYNGQPWNVTEYINYLSWNIQNDTCSFDVHHYYIYYGSDSANLAFLDSTSSRDDTTYQHVLTESLAGCYAITAIDRVGNQSKYSNIFCIDNCPYYVLPNVFTPNGDGQNDLFHPFLPYRFVPKIEMKIFNRWGDKVFETEDPEINWDGKDMKGHELNDGVYLYAGYYYEQHQSGLVQKPLSGQKKGGGFIHLIRGK